MSEYTLYTISNKLQKSYNWDFEHNKIYPKIKGIGKFYQSVGEENPSIIEEHFPCWSLLVLPMIQEDTKDIKFNTLAYLFYLASMLTFGEKPIIVFTTGKAKHFSEQGLEEFISLFSNHYDMVVSDYCKENNTTFKAILDEETKDVYEKNNNENFESLMYSMVYNMLTVGQNAIIHEMHEIQHKLVEIISKLNYIDISDMPDVTAKLRKINEKLENIYEEKFAAMKNYLEAEDLLPDLMTIINDNKVIKEVELKSELQLEVEAFRKKNKA